MKKIIQKTITLSLLTSSLLIASVNIEETNMQAIGLIKKNDLTQAYTLLEKVYNSGDFNNQTLFLLGTSAQKNGDIDSAIRYFEELLSKDESAQRIRLDLAVLYYKKKDLKKAKELLLVVKSSNPPKKVGDNIEKFLVAIKRGVPKSYSSYVNIGYLVDSNANQGVSEDTIIIDNFRFDPADYDMQKTSDTAVKYGFGLNHIKTFGSTYALQSSVNINMINYSELDNLDSKSLSLSVAPTWKQNKKTTISIPLIASVIKYGHTDKYFSISKGIAPQINYKVKKDLSLNAVLGLNWKDYYQASEKESHSWSFSPSAKYLINQSSWINLGGYLGKENSKTNTSSNSAKGLNLGYYKGLNKEINLYLATSYNKTAYDGSANREDKALMISGTLSCFVDTINSSISLNLSQTKNNSNLDIYEYKRNLIGLNLGYRF